MLPNRLAILMGDPHLGNFIIASPIITQLTRLFPAADRLLVVHAGHRRLVERIPGLSAIETVATDARKRGPGEWAQGCAMVGRLRRFAPDATVSFGGNKMLTLAGGFSGARLRIGRPADGYPRFFNCHRHNPQGTDFHRQAIYGEIAGGLSEEIATPTAPVIEPTAEDLADWQVTSDRLGLDPRRLVCLHVGAGKAYKLWPCERFAALADNLNEHNLQAVLIGTLADADRINQVRGMCRTPVPDLSGAISRNAELGMLGSCRLFVGNDSGPMHLASAAGAPVLGLFGPTDPARWRPLGPNSRVLRGDRPATDSSRKRTGSREAAGGEYDLASLTLAQVQDEVDDLLARSAGSFNRAAGRMFPG